MKTSFTRFLKVQNAGDNYKKEVVPRLLLMGKWLIHAGIPPESVVEVTNPEKGILHLRVQEKSKSGLK